MQLIFYQINIKLFLKKMFFYSYKRYLEEEVTIKFNTDLPKDAENQIKINTVQNVKEMIHQVINL